MLNNSNMLINQRLIITSNGLVLIFVICDFLSARSQLETTLECKHLLFPPKFKKKRNEDKTQFHNLLISKNYDMN